MSELGKLMRLSGGCAQPLFAVAGDEGISDVLAAHLRDERRDPLSEPAFHPSHTRIFSGLGNAIGGFFARVRKPRSRRTPLLTGLD